MSSVELDEFLGAARTCRVATVNAHGPHVSPLWFVWLDGALWLYSVIRSQRWVDLSRDPRVAVVIDDGESYAEIRGAELRGSVTIVGEVPRIGTRKEPELARVERAFVRKYYVGTNQMEYDGRHGWLRLAPRETVSWDFRKLAAIPAPFESR